MTQPATRSWVTSRHLVGGLIMFAIEGAIVAGLAVVAFVISIVILAIL